MTNETTIAPMAPSDDAQRTIPPEVMEKVVIGGDLSELNASQRAEYYTAVCRSLGLNPLPKPWYPCQLCSCFCQYVMRIAGPGPRSPKA